MASQKVERIGWAVAIVFTILWVGGWVLWYWPR